MAKDPVCGMDVDPKTAGGKSEYKGQTYYFCSPGCRKSFDAYPHPYHWLFGLAGGLAGIPIGWLWYRWRGDIF